MTIRAKRRSEKTVIDLTGPQGNAFCLLGIVRNSFRGSPELVEKICNEMTSGDYEHLIQTFDQYLGDHFILER
jgi:hypothetical protein